MRALNRVSCSGFDYSRTMAESEVGSAITTGAGFLLEPVGATEIFTPEMLSDEHRMMKEMTDGFMHREVEPRVAEIEAKKPGLMQQLLHKAVELGLLGHDIPEAYGGLGGSLDRKSTRLNSSHT